MDYRKMLTKKGVNPFPKVSKDCFTLKSLGALPQDIDIFRELTGSPNLQGDLSTVTSPSLLSLYSKIYNGSYWYGNLGLLFYNEPNQYDSSLLPVNGTRDRLLGLLTESEIEEWDKGIADLGTAQFSLWKKGGY